MSRLSSSMVPTTILLAAEFELLPNLEGAFTSRHHAGDDAAVDLR